jgi:hypothetical protein
MAYSRTTTWVPITRDMRELLYAHGGAAITRLESFGMDDRRESACAVLLAGAAPLVGMTMLGWEAGATIAVLLANLLIGLTDDLVRIGLSMERRQETLHERVQDEFVWPVARAMSLGRKTVYAKFLPSESDIETGLAQSPTWLAAGLAYLIGGFTAFMLTGSGSPMGAGDLLFLGSLPNLGLSLATSVLHGVNRHPHWRQAGSVRLQTVATTGYATAIIAAAVFFVMTAPSFKASSGTVLAWCACLATLLHGGWRVWRLPLLRDSARWLKRSMHRMGK